MSISTRTWTEATRGVAHTDDAEALRVTADFFSLPRTGEMMSSITGLKAPSLHDVLTGKTKKSTRHAHLQVIRQLVEMTAEWRRRNGDVDQLGEAWLRNTVLDTSKGERPAVEVMADPVLAREVLEDIRGALSA